MGLFQSIHTGSVCIDNSTVKSTWNPPDNDWSHMMWIAFHRWIVSVDTVRINNMENRCYVPFGSIFDNTIGLEKKKGMNVSVNKIPLCSQSFVFLFFFFFLINNISSFNSAIYLKFQAASSYHVFYLNKLYTIVKLRANADICELHIG